jgi:uncharacterized membrane protein YtjA (UPF0391 family)
MREVHACDRARGLNSTRRDQGDRVFNWAITFLLVAILAAIFGFGEITASVAGVAKVTAVVAFTLAVVSLLLPPWHRE